VKIENGQLTADLLVLMVAGTAAPTSRRLFTTDQHSKIKFLVDIGSNLCVFPRSRVHGQYQEVPYILSASNGSTIRTFGVLPLSLNLGLRRNFTWQFTIANVTTPILGADFLAHYNLLPDLRNARLIDGTTSLTASC